MTALLVFAALALVPGTARAAPTSSGTFVGVFPFRALDTRTDRPLRPGEHRTVRFFTSRAPPADAIVAVVNLTGVDPSQGTLLTAQPRAERPVTSSLNLRTGTPRSRRGGCWTPGTAATSTPTAR